MKIKNLLTVVAILFAVLACNKKDEIKNPIDQKGEKSLLIRINTKNIKTRAIEEKVDLNDPDQKKTGLNSLDLFVLSGDDIIKYVKASAEQIDEAQTPSGLALADVPKAADGLIAVANRNNIISDANMPGVYGKKADVLALGFSVSSQQPSTSADKVSNVVMMGTGTITDLPTTPNEAKADIQLKPLVARVEISGEPVLCEGMSEFKVLGVSLQGYLKQHAKTDVVPLIPDETVTATSYPLFPITTYPLQDEVTGENWLKLKARTHAAAYHLFKGSKVGIVLEVSYLWNGTPNDKIKHRFITLTDLKLIAADNSLKDIDGGLASAVIYKVDLKKIDWNKSGEYEDPDDNPYDDDDPDAPWPPNHPDRPDVITPDVIDPTPNAKKKNVSIILTIVEWTDLDVIGVL